MTITSHTEYSRNICPRSKINQVSYLQFFNKHKIRLDQCNYVLFIKLEFGILYHRMPMTLYSYC